MEPFHTQRQFTCSVRLLSWNGTVPVNRIFAVDSEPGHSTDLVESARSLTVAPLSHLEKTFWARSPPRSLPQPYPLAPDTLVYRKGQR
jgi:hypothetical protein